MIKIRDDTRHRRRRERKINLMSATNGSLEQKPPLSPQEIQSDMWMELCAALLRGISSAIM